MSNLAARGTLGDFLPIALFMALVMSAFISQIQLAIVAGAALCAVYAGTGNFSRGLKKNNVYSCILCSFLFIPAFINYHHGLSPVFYFLSTVATFFAAMRASNKPPIVLLRAFNWMFWAAVAAIAWVLYTYWGYPEPFGMVIEGSSTNGIPAYLIVLQISLSLAAYLVHGRLPVLSILFTFATAFFGNGRGSLVVAALIIIVTFTFNAALVGLHKSKLRWGYWLLLTLLTAAGVIWGRELIDLLYAYTKLSVGLVDSNRLEIWDHYSRKIDGFTLLFGADYSGTVIQNEYRGNPHIAYIRTHSLFGLPLTLLAIASPALVLFVRKKLAPKLVFFVFISLAALRATSEPIFFPTLLDFFYFTWFFMYVKYAAPERIRVHASSGGGATNV